MIIQAIAIDDEPAALRVLEAHAAKLPFLNLKAAFTSPAEALEFVQREEVHLAFLDVQMPELLGVEIAPLFTHHGIQTVFVTAHEQYAVKGFQLQALDYLLKPVALPRFIEACNRALQQVQRDRKERPGLFVKDGYDWVKVDLSLVQFIRSDTNLLFFHQAGKTICTRMTMTKALDLLPPQEFLRVHKSYIVSLKAVQKLEK
ncbi:MAG: LytTR family DNA-binding domain-containing protein, partial [Bacteroidota bacterium]